MADDSDQDEREETGEAAGEARDEDGGASTGDETETPVDEDASGDDGSPDEEADQEEAPEEDVTGESSTEDEPAPDVSDASEEQDEEPEDRGEGDEIHGEEGEEFEESVVHVNRCCKVVQGGKQFSFSALVVAGNRNGKISYGFGKANQVPQAIQKAIQDSRKRIIDVPIVHGTTPHRVELEYCSTKLLLRPASPGTGVIAALPVRTTVNLAGITDLLTKVYGSTNPINCVKAVYQGLKSLRTKEEIEDLRDVKIT